MKFNFPHKVSINKDYCKITLRVSSEEYDKNKKRISKRVREMMNIFDKSKNRTQIQEVVITEFHN